MAFPFRSRTIGMLVRTIDQAYSNTEIGTLLLDAEADQWDPPKPANKQDRLQRLFRAMREDVSDEAETAALDIARRLLSAGAERARSRRPMVWWKEAVDTLAADGWEYNLDADRLVSTVPGVRVAQETSRLEDELARRGWTDAAGHYRQALEAFSRAEWAGSNAQLRSVLEDVLLSAAKAVTGRRPQQPRAVIDILKDKWSLAEGEYDLLRGLWDLSQHRGSHPGLSDQEESRFRLMCVTSECRFLLARLPG
jgi:hypothetical protein